MRRFFDFFARRQQPPKALDGAMPATSSTGLRRSNERIQWLASSFRDIENFRVHAASVADDLGPSSINDLASLFHADHTPPPEFANAFGGLGAWLTARQFAIFEVFYHFGDKAIPVLKQVAFGEYDWTQGNAIEILCRLAADGVRRDEIVDELIEHLPEMREEAHGYALGPLLNQSATNPELRDVLAKLLTVPEFKSRHDELLSDQRHG